MTPEERAAGAPKASPLEGTWDKPHSELAPPLLQRGSWVDFLLPSRTRGPQDSGQLPLLLCFAPREARALPITWCSGVAHIALPSSWVTGVDLPGSSRLHGLFCQWG